MCIFKPWTCTKIQSTRSHGAAPIHLFLPQPLMMAKSPYTMYQATKSIKFYYNPFLEFMQKPFRCLCRHFVKKNRNVESDW